MKDQKDNSPKSEQKSYLDKLETATPTQASQSIIAKIMQLLTRTTNSGQ
ncbi:MAG: hypothetical protein WAV40_04835 [Microgenomates group bacterium]